MSSTIFTYHWISSLLYCTSSWILLMNCLFSFSRLNG
jgi:hypothetical protein